jgi:hypothetical protein
MLHVIKNFWINLIFYADKQSLQISSQKPWGTWQQRAGRGRAKTKVGGIDGRRCGSPSEGGQPSVQRGPEISFREFSSGISHVILSARAIGASGLTCSSGVRYPTAVSVEAGLLYAL